ncbi:glycosyltransferase family 9 protein [Spongorhabdus nitratireducens]
MEYTTAINHRTILKQSRIAITPIATLGDGLIFLVVAQCLADQGHHVCFYSNTLQGLNNWFPDIEIKPLPQGGDLTAELNQADLVICDPHQPHAAQRIKGSTLLSAKSAWITTSRMPSGQPIATINPKLSFSVLGTEMPDGTLCRRHLGNLSMVRFAMEYCRDAFGCQQPRKHPRLQVPSRLRFRSRRERVAIFPETPIPENNYPLKYYLKIARELRDNGCIPEFVLTPGQQQKLGLDLTLLGLRHRSFDDLGSLAEYIYESGCVISNDSGGGHLSSLLNIPTVTIYKKRDEFEWRPGWKNSHIVRPLFSLKAGQRRIWGPFVNRRRIIRYVLDHTDHVTEM